MSENLTIIDSEYTAWIEDLIQRYHKRSIFLSEFELAKLYPDKIESTIPTIEEIEKKLN